MASCSAERMLTRSMRDSKTSSSTSSRQGGTALQIVQDGLRALDLLVLAGGFQDAAAELAQLPQLVADLILLR